jgi:hypothetical protein
MIARMIPTASPHLDQARSRFIRSTRRFIEGARLQRERVLERSATAPRLLEGSPHEVIDLTGQPSTDLDYYTYEMARLQGS